MSPRDVQKLVESIPYATTLGIKARLKDEYLTLILPYTDSNIGNPALPALHGGVVGGFMEVCAMAELKRRSLELGYPHAKFAKTIGINIDYLRRGKPAETFARAEIFKEGSRVANVRVRAWQESEDAPIAALSGHFLLPHTGD